jgi:hypothetical protein
MSKFDDRELKRLFVEITKGYTEVRRGKEVFYIKHFNQEDQFEIDDFYFQKLESLKDSGIPTEEQVLEQLAKKKIWTTQDEVWLSQKELEINQLVKTRDKQSLPSQIEYFDGLIQTERTELFRKKAQRAGLIGDTRERFANQSVNSYFILQSFYKDKECQNLLVSPEEFEEMEDDTLLDFSLLYSKSMKMYNDESIKKVAVCSFFQNLFYLAENIQQFWGKPIKDLTIYQTELSSYGRYFKSVLQNSEHEIPEEIRSDPDKLLGFAKMDNKMKENLSKGSGQNASFTGTKEDAKKLGIKLTNEYSKHAKRLGRNLTRDDMLMIDKGEGHKIKV